ncbi:MAG: OmpA family protein [Elusimicrobia bacterium]|nr:OmpA family protein [Elusimicrobiota bacterium]
MIPYLHRLPVATVEDNPLWLVVLADMMTNLMLFFLVMYALSLQSPSARAEMARAFDAADVVDVKPRPADERALREFQELKAAARLKELFADTTLAEHVIRVRLRNQILFPSGLSTLSAGADEPLMKLARVLGELPNTVVVEGHTDDVRLSRSPYRSNWELSVSRSNSVIELLARRGISPERLVAAGYGEHRPVAANDSAEGRARNRRVEILILRGEEPRP